MDAHAHAHIEQLLNLRWPQTTAAQGTQLVPATIEMHSYWTVMTLMASLCRKAPAAVSSHPKGCGRSRPRMAPALPAKFRIPIPRLIKYECNSVKPRTAEARPLARAPRAAPLCDPAVCISRARRYKPAHDATMIMRRYEI